MKKISTIVIGLSLIVSSALYADNNDHTGDHMHQGKMANHANANGMTNSSMSNSNMGAYHNQMMINGYKVILSSKKPLKDGKNHMFVTLEKDGKSIKNAKDVKIKFDMPMMPGMDFTENATLSGNGYNCNVDFSMQGEWSYELNFTTSDGKMHQTKGSVNL